MSWRKRSCGVASAAPLALLLAAATALAAAPAAPTRAQYTERVEPICEAGTRANRGVLNGVEEMVRAGELRSASVRFERAATALEGVIERVGAVPRPSADIARLSSWLARARSGTGRLREIAAALRAGRRNEAQRLAPELLRAARQANALVVGFDFVYCRLNPARFV